MGEFDYGGQAVIEGVMMRGQQTMAVAVRHPDGNIVVHSEPLNPRIYGSAWSKVPFLRGTVMLWDTIVLGIRSLMFSADVAMGEEDVEFSGPLAWGTMALSLALGLGFFLLVPVLLVRLVDPYLHSSFLSNLVEGLIRLAFFLAYVYAIGLLPDIRRVFAYHGAEHKTISAYEAGVPLEPAAIQTYHTAHARCGTGFLLVFLVIATFVFSLLGKPSLLWRLASRLALLPVIAALAYEMIKFSAAHTNNPLISTLILKPSLALQSLTTRQPDDAMVEVAIAALKQVLSTEGRLFSTS